MHAGAYTEAIWHFAGYLHIAETLLSRPEVYDGDRQRPQSDDDPAILADRIHRLQLEEFISQPVRIAEQTAGEPTPLMLRIAPATGPKPSVSLSSQHSQTPMHLSTIDIDVTGPYWSIGGRYLIQVDYQNGGTETLLAVHQINKADDRDVLTSDAIRYPDGSLVILPAVDVEHTIAQMIEQSHDATPAWFPWHSMWNTQSLIEAVAARDEVWARDGHPSGETTPSTPDGHYVDGRISSEALPDPKADQIVPWAQPDPTEAHEIAQTVSMLRSTHGIATVAETGLNTQFNGAEIFDINEATNSLMIGGNYYFSRGIVQINVLTDNDYVNIAHSDGVTPSIWTNGNEVHNVADFVTHEMTASYRGAAGTPFWNVDVLHGNFYDVKTVIQFNGLDDSDRTVQKMAKTYFQTQTGGAEQANIAQITNLDYYDVIIIGGDYHRADWIYQYNILLDSDYAKIYMGSDGNNGIVEVTTGFNTLSNKAEITTYDSDFFQGLNQSQRDLMGSLSQGVTALTPSADWQLAGDASGSLRILYVSGDYYDVNAISQINVMADVDQSIQASANGGLQGIAAGGNAASNTARIIDPGTLSTSKYLGGQAYEDTILIQANIVTDSDLVTIHDTTTLVPELVAFAHDADAAVATDNPLYKPADAAHHDLLM